MRTRGSAEELERRRRLAVTRVLEGNTPEFVANFLGHGKVTSFYAPYFCPKCKKEANVLLSVEAMARASSAKAPTEKCPTCKGAMEFDDIEEEYFSFLENIAS